MVWLPAPVVLALLLAVTPPSASQALPADLEPLVKSLQRYGFVVRFEPPPVRGVYGLFEGRSRTLWISPISFALGIGRHTLLHEAAHAVQSCGPGGMGPVGWRLPLPAVVRQEIKGITYIAYGHGNRLVEREAFALQAQPNAVSLLIQGLAQRCKGRLGR